MSTATVATDARPAVVHPEPDEPTGPVIEIGPYVPTGVLLRMATDPSVPVRRYAAAHPRTPIPALIKLANDRSHTVRRTAQHNPALPAHIRALHRLL